MFVRSVCNRNSAKNSSAARKDEVKYIAHTSKIPSQFPKQVNLVHILIIWKYGPHNEDFLKTYSYFKNIV